MKYLAAQIFNVSQESVTAEQIGFVINQMHFSADYYAILQNTLKAQYESELNLQGNFNE